MILQLKITLLYVLIFGFCIFTISSEEILLVVEHWPPWEIAYDKNKEKVTGGLAIELAEELFSRLNIKIRLDTVPWKRALISIEKGRADLIPMVAKTPEREQYMVYTHPIYTDPILLVYSTDKFSSFEWEDWKDLESYRIGITRGYYYGVPWNKALKKYGFNVVESASDIINIDMVLLGRVDLTLQFYSICKNIFKEFPGHEKLKFASKPVHKNVLHFGISKKSHLAAKLSEINKTIQEMKSDGTFKNILKDLYHEE